MERTLDFSSVTSYDLNFDGRNFVLKLNQGDFVTNIRVTGSDVMTIVDQTRSPVSACRMTGKKMGSKLPLGRKPSARSVAEQGNGSTAVKTSHLTRLNEVQVKEIRANWEDTVKACGGKKGEAAKQLASVYNCSDKNIYAIIYRYSWNHI